MKRRGGSSQISWDLQGGRAAMTAMQVCLLKIYVFCFSSELDRSALKLSVARLRWMYFSGFRGE